MERFKLLGIFFLVVLCMCFISNPVFSGEHPWDESEEPNSGGGLSNDSTNPGDGTDPIESVVANGDPSFEGLMFSLSYSITLWYYESFFETQPMRETNDYKAKKVYRGVYRTNDNMR